ncbi:hypothetical protein [Micromonospora sp. NPDC049679]|uniref:hypothetical protein n=1 Tax=Micromonospora sp. NPDC049679 TaxID=3155920 RepID=UPI0033CB8C21
MYNHDGHGMRRGGAKQPAAGARMWRPARDFTGAVGTRAREVASGVRQVAERVPESTGKPRALMLATTAGALLIVAAAGFLLGRLARSTPTLGHIARTALERGTYRGGTPAHRTGEGDRAERAGPRSARPGPGGLGRPGPSAGRPGPGGLGAPGGRRDAGKAGFSDETVRSPSATTPSNAYEVPPGRTTASPVNPVDEPVIPAGREAGYPTEPLRRKPDRGH